MGFSLKRIPATKFDLSQDQLESYEKIRQLALAYDKARILSESVIVNILSALYPELSDEDKIYRIERWCARPTTSLDKLDAMMTGKEPLEYQKDQPRPIPAHRPVQRVDFKIEEKGSIEKINTADMDPEMAAMVRNLQKKFKSKY